ncbi:MAG: TIGR03936 family radical SAM-associated protein, partial [Desulfovibrionaceae bacterium]
ACQGCGVCAIGKRKSRLAQQSMSKDIRPRLAPDIAPSEEAAGEKPDASVRQRDDLGRKAAQYRIWYRKAGPAAWLSQLELGRVLERACRRAGLPLSFSKGFHPLPRLSFGRALPVGLVSMSEWVNLVLREDVPPETLRRALSEQLPEGLDVLKVHRLTLGKRQPQPDYETFILNLRTDPVAARELRERLIQAGAAESLPVTKKTKKGEKTVDAAPMLRRVAGGPGGSLLLTLDWSSDYLNPLTLLAAVVPEAGPAEMELIKTGQFFTLQTLPDGYAA